MHFLLWLLLVSCLLTSCENYPQDPRHTLLQAREDSLRVGVSHSPPYVNTHTQPYSGIEVDLIQEFAASIGSPIAWTEGSETALMEDLRHYRLSIVASGLDKKSVWVRHVALTKPYDKQHVLAVPKGENAFVLELEKFLLQP